jgi:NADH dehydrogenase
MLGAPLDRAGRVLVKPDLSVPGHPEVFVAGDLAAAEWPEHGPPQSGTLATISDLNKRTRYVPGVAPAAIQMGKFAARQIKRSLAGQPREVFAYRDKGSLATIGRSRAVADLGKLRISGYFAWLSWLFVHLFFLIGFRNRIMVLMEWAWAYLTYQGNARLITEPRAAKKDEAPRAKAG